MRTLWVRGALALMAVGIAWSCADDGTDPLEEPPTLEELPARLVSALCPELETCLGDNSDRFFGPDGCEGRLTAQLEDGDFNATIQAVEAGRVTYDASKVDACIASVRGTGCGFQTTRSFENDSCRLVLEGNVELGGDCAIDEECAGIAFCQRSGDQCPGTCTALLEAGDSCTSDDQCANGLACASTTGRCLSPGRLGEDCGRSSDAPCAAGLVCLGASGTTAGECSDPEELYVAQLGEDCSPGEQMLCVDQLACAVMMPVEGTPRFKCMERHDLNSDCTFGAPSQCPDDAYCSGVDFTKGDYEGTCAKLPEEGDACNAQGGAPCAAGLSCDEDDICRALGRLGDDCASDEACASGYCADGECERPMGCTLEAD